MSVLLQKYMNGRFALDVISQQGFYFRALHQYPDDPEEGISRHVSCAGRDAVEGVKELLGISASDYDAGIEQEVRDLDDSLRSIFFSQSWFLSDLSSPDMWREYADYDIDENKDSVLFVVRQPFYYQEMYRVVKGSLQAKKVRYVSDKTADSDRFFTKGKRFSYEEEYRFLINASNLSIYNKGILDFDFGEVVRGLGGIDSSEYVVDRDDFHRVDENGFYVKVDFSKIDLMVCVPCDASESFKNKISELLDCFGLSPVCINPKFVVGFK